MVELQQHAEAFADAGVALFAISYDEVAALADYAANHGVSFHLLSDPDSAIIERFGILNTLIDPEDHPWYGIPFPGSYVVDGDGTIIAKFFETSLHFRASADQLLRAALGEQIELAPLEATDGQVAFDVSFDGTVLHPGVVRDLIVRFAVPHGQHLYGEPVPEGMVATSVEIDPTLGLVVKAPVMPATTPHTLDGTGDTLQIFEGDVVIRVPVAHVGRSLERRDDGSLVQQVSGTVRWQSCDDHTCHLPRTERFSIDIPAAGHNRPEAEGDDGMDVRSHLIAMVARRTDRSIAEIFTAMTSPDD